MPAKQQSPSSSEQSTDLGKICFICYCLPSDPQVGDFSFGDDPSRMNYCLFLLDLDAEESSDYVPVNPTLCFDSIRLGNFNLNPDRRPRMDHLGVYGHCVLGSKLYLFGRGKKDVFSYELPCCSASVPSLSSPLELTDDKLSFAPRMNSPKYYPLGCQTPDGRKMIVFSTQLDVAGDDENVDFELFDPVEGIWTPLADLRPLLHSVGLLDRYVSVLSYAFIDNGPVLLVTTSLGNFALNTEEDNAVWSKIRDFEFPLSGYHGYYCMLVRGRLCLMDRFAWLDGTDPWEWLSCPGELKPSPGSGITWLSSNRFCVVRNYIEASTRKPHLIIDVCEFDSLVDTDEVPALKVNKTFKFVVGHQIEPIFSTKSLFPIRFLEEGV